MRKVEVARSELWNNLVDSGANRRGRLESNLGAGRYTALLGDENAGNTGLRSDDARLMDKE